LAVLGFGILVSVIAWPWLSVHFLSPPPDVYIAICRKDSSEVTLVSVREAGKKRRSRRVKVGGDKKKADIYVDGLRPVEFTVDVRGDKVILADAIKGESKATFRQLSSEGVITSNPGIRLWVAAKRSSLDGAAF
jgi:hypothetical protein